MKVIYKIVGIVVVGYIVFVNSQVLKATSIRIINQAQYSIPQGIVGPTIVKYSIGNTEIIDENGIVLFRDERTVSFGQEKTVEFNRVACPFTVVCDLFIPGHQDIKKVTYHVSSDCDKHKIVTIRMLVKTNRNGTFKEAYPVVLDSTRVSLSKY